jgi:hypothetical protein
MGFRDDDMYELALSQPPSGQRSAVNDSLFLNTDANPHFNLRDGSVCRIRPIDKGDRQLLQAGFQRLSPNSRRMRFFSVKKALTESDLDFLTNPDGRDHIALGAVRLDAQGNEVEGSADEIYEWLKICWPTHTHSTVQERVFTVPAHPDRLNLESAHRHGAGAAARRRTGCVPG